MDKRILKVLITMVLVIFTLSGVIFGLESTKPKVTVNGKVLDSEAMIINDRTYIPLRAVGEALGAEVNWNGNTNTAEVNLKNDNTIPDILKKVSPSVVGIIGSLAPDEESDYIENKYADYLAHGSGVIIKSTGEILTNAHVVKDMEKVVVVLSDGSGYEGKVSCIDEQADLALVKINKNDCPAATLGKQEDIISGRTVIAIGTPVDFSLRNSASLGIISGINRGVGSEYALIQTDAAINPGNSGGPLVNINGEVIGINSSKFFATGIEGMGFSIPINTIQYVLNQFENNGKVIRPFIGASFKEGWAARTGLPSHEGLTVNKVEKGSPAETNGLKLEDIVMSINDHEVNSNVDLHELLKQFKPNDKATLKIKRGNAITSIAFVFGVDEKKK